MWAFDVTNGNTRATKDISKMAKWQNDSKTALLAWYVKDVDSSWLHMFEIFEDHQFTQLKWYYQKHPPEIFYKKMSSEKFCNVLLSI